MEMLIIVLVAAAVCAYFLWGRKPASATNSGGTAATTPLDSLEAYRQSRPSNFYLGKPSCSQCGSYFVDQGSCRNCGITLFRC